MGKRVVRELVVLFLLACRFRASRGVSQVEGHEDTVWIGHVVTEWRTFGEAMAPVERTRGLKIVPGTGLEAQARHPAFSRGRNDVTAWCVPRLFAARTAQCTST